MLPRQANISPARRAPAADQAAPVVMKIQEMSNRLMAGEDVNGDGKVTWHASEGGLNAAEQHMGFMTKGEGLTS